MVEDVPRERVPSVCLEALGDVDSARVHFGTLLTGTARFLADAIINPRTPAAPPAALDDSLPGGARGLRLALPVRLGDARGRESCPRSVPWAS